MANAEPDVAARFYRGAARLILSRHPPPDLRGAIVLLPNYHAAAPLAKALASVAGLPALLLPQMVTLGDLLQRFVPDQPVLPDTQRIATLYQVLRDKDWFADANLWSLSRELLALMDELTRHRVALPESAEDFADRLKLAYQAQDCQALQFEARVVHELWYAMAASGEADSCSAYQMRLGLLAQRLDQPLYVLQSCSPDAPEARFLDACRERIPVEIFDLPGMAAQDASCALIHAALRVQPGADLLGTAAAMDGSGELGRNGRMLRLFGAQGMEQEAMAADLQVRRWLLDGKRSIAVVVQDRLVARRLRALLERAAIQVQDETGWTFATLSISTVLMRWLEALQGDFYYHDLLDLLKSPFLFADNPAQRKQAAFLFEQMVRKHGVISDLAAYISVAQRKAPELVLPLARFRQAALAMKARSARLSSWIAALQQSLEILGIVQGWQQDAAGQQLLQLFALWQEELVDDSATFSFSEWRSWLTQQLDLNTCRDVSVDSPVLFTHLPATRWRSFDAVLLLGSDAAHLPAPVDAGQWFNDAVRISLGLPHSGAQQDKARDDLLSLLALNDCVLVTWQAARSAEPNLLSPYFEMLRAMHLLAFGGDLMERELAGMLESAQVVVESGGAVQQSAMPSPAVRADLVPQRISPSGYNSLVACPYQYFVRHVLHLNELDEVREELDKRDYGTWVHAVLQRFHEELPVVSGRNDAEAIMLRISREVFADALEHDYLAQGWLLRWQAQIPRYLEWQRENEAAGWRYLASEQPFRVDVDANLQLTGRLDRVDSSLAEPDRLFVFDYKTQSVPSLKSKLKEPGEDVQLACYAHVRQAACAAFVSLEDEVVAVSSDDIGELARQNVERLAELFGQIRDGAGLPAHGAEKICSYCEMRGLCRNGEWQKEEGLGG